MMRDVMQCWLISGEFAVLDGIAIKPQSEFRQSLLPRKIRGNTATIYFTRDDSGREWMLKKFDDDKVVDPAYLSANCLLIPRETGFEAGYKRRILGQQSVGSEGFHHLELQSWIHGTVLMPLVNGGPWRSLQASFLSRIERLLLCRELCDQIERLENLGLAHGDLSDDNLLVDATNSRVYLVDWDGMYHNSLNPPLYISPGTLGYQAPFCRAETQNNAQPIWCEYADRFALAILLVEILLSDVQINNNGPMFPQTEIDQRYGKSITDARNSLSLLIPAAVDLFDTALNAMSFPQCPAPALWGRIIREALPTEAREIWESESIPEELPEIVYSAKYNHHFVTINQALFVKARIRDFIKAPTGRRR